MSGIVGIYYLDQEPIDRENIGQMLDILAHREPEGADIWCEGSVGLGHRMLWTTPESLQEKLPLVNHSRNLVITADARIDNREELIVALELNDRPAEKITDSQLILAAYEKWGEQCPEKLLGDFAFAIWDKYKQILFCARDHVGVKPFYYYHQSGQGFIFASEIKALFCLPFVPKRLNEVRMADYVALMMEDKVITTYDNILRLPPAHTMVVSQSGIELNCYWSLDPNRELILDSDEAYAEAFHELFAEEIDRRIRSAFPIASHWSGGLDGSIPFLHITLSIMLLNPSILVSLSHGFAKLGCSRLDSSSITCVARKLLAETGDTQLHSFSNIFDKVTECYERPFINFHGLSRLKNLADLGHQEAEAFYEYFFCNSPQSLIKHYSILHLKTLAKQFRWRDISTRSVFNIPYIISPRNTSILSPVPKLKWTHTNRELILDSDEAYVKAFRYIFTEARCCLCSALPIGSHYEYESQDRYQAAELLYQQALQLSKRLLREEHPLVATSLNNLAFLYQSQGKYQEREITTLNNLGCAYSDLGDYPRAIDHHQQSFNIAKDIDDLNVRCINSLIMPTVCRQLSYFLGGLSTIIVRLLIGQSIIFGCLEPLPFKHFSSLAFFDSS